MGIVGSLDVGVGHDDFRADLLLDHHRFLEVEPRTLAQFIVGHPARLQLRAELRFAHVLVQPQLLDVLVDLRVIDLVIVLLHFLLEQFLADQRLHRGLGGFRSREVIGLDRLAVLRCEVLDLAHRDRVAVNAGDHAIHRRRARYHHLVRGLLLFHRSRRRWLRLFFLREDRRER